MIEAFGISWELMMVRALFSRVEKYLSKQIKKWSYKLKIFIQYFSNELNLDDGDALEWLYWHRLYRGHQGIID